MLKKTHKNPLFLKPKIRTHTYPKRIFMQFVKESSLRDEM